MEPLITSSKRVSQASAHVVDCSFTRTGPGLVADEVVQIGPVGSGMAVSQAFGNLLIDTGTTPNAEFIFRSAEYVQGAHIARIKQLVSQRIANQNFHIAIADIQGENLNFTTSSDGLSITVAMPVGHGFTSLNVGQSCFLGGAAGIATSVPGRYAITDVSGDFVTFSPVFSCTWTRSTTTATVTFQGGNPIFNLNETATVSASSDVAAIVNGVVTLLTQASGGVTTFTCLNAGATSGTLTLSMTQKAWTGSSSGTVTVYGWNYIHFVKNGTTGTTCGIDTQRKGWSSGDTLATVISDVTGGVGHVLQAYGDGQTESFASASPTSTVVTVQFAGSGSRVDGLPSTDDKLYLICSTFNGVSAPASTTRLTIGHFRLVDIGINKVQISGIEQTGTTSAVSVMSTLGSQLNAQVTGAAALGSTATGNPVFTAGVSATAIQTARTAGQVVTPAMDKIGRTIPANEQIRDLTIMSPMVTLTTTTETTIVAAVASIFNDMRAAVITNSSATGTLVSFRTTTGGSIVFNVFVPATTTLTVSIPVAARQATVNTNWTAQLGTAVTSVFITPFVIQVN